MTLHGMLEAEDKGMWFHKILKSLLAKEHLSGRDAMRGMQI